MDASIGFETLRAENSGSAMNDTLGFFANFTSAYVSSPSSTLSTAMNSAKTVMFLADADLIALGVVQAVNSCGGPYIPFRVGRVDATGPGNFGTPEPETPIDETLSRAEISGFSQTEFM